MTVTAKAQDGALDAEQSRREVENNENRREGPTDFFILQHSLFLQNAGGQVKPAKNSGKDK